MVYRREWHGPCTAQIRQRTRRNPTIEALRPYVPRSSPWSCSKIRQQRKKALHVRRAINQGPEQTVCCLKENKDEKRTLTPISSPPLGIDTRLAAQPLSLPTPKAYNDNTVYQPVVQESVDMGVDLDSRLVRGSPIGKDPAICVLFQVQAYTSTPRRTRMLAVAWHITINFYFDVELRLSKVSQIQSTGFRKQESK